MYLWHQCLCGLLPPCFHSWGQLYVVCSYFQPFLVFYVRSFPFTKQHFISWKAELLLLCYLDPNQSSYILIITSIINEMPPASVSSGAVLKCVAEKGHFLERPLSWGVLFLPHQLWSAPTPAKLMSCSSKSKSSMGTPKRCQAFLLQFFFSHS